MKFDFIHEKEFDTKYILRECIDELLNCDICENNSNSFIICNQCYNGVCYECDKQIRTKICPFCRKFNSSDNPFQKINIEEEIIDEKKYIDIYYKIILKCLLHLNY